MIDSLASNIRENIELESEIIGDGQGIHWPDVDEDISVVGMLYGTPARRPKKKVTYIKDR